MRIVVDTNIIVSRTLSSLGAPAEILRLWWQERFELAVSEPILEEYERALGYERIRARHGLSGEAIRELVGGFREFAILVEPSEMPAVIEDDPDDDKFLWCADAVGAEFIVSRDAHLLRLRRYKAIEIVSPGAFLAFLATPG